LFHAKPGIPNGKHRTTPVIHIAACGSRHHDTNAAGLLKMHQVTLS